MRGNWNSPFYSTSTTGLDAADALNFRIEVAKDGNFSNTAPGNIITTNIKDVPPADVAAFGDSIAAVPPAPNHINLAAPPATPPALDFPAADFTFYKFSNSVLVPADATNPHARIIAESVAGITTSEHILIDNIIFRVNSSPSLNASTTGQGHVHQQRNRRNDG